MQILWNADSDCGSEVGPESLHFYKLPEMLLDPDHTPYVNHAFQRPFKESILSMSYRWEMGGEKKDPPSQSKWVAEEGSETSQTFLTSYNKKEKWKTRKIDKYMYVCIHVCVYMCNDTEDISFQ